MKILTIITILIISQSIHANQMLNTEYIASKLSEIIYTKSFDNLTLYQINDTLFYGQNYPEEKFPIFVINRDIFIPIFVVESDTTNISHSYLRKFISKKMMGYFGVQYLIPLSKIDNIFEEFKKNKSRIKIMDVYDCGLENYNGYEGEVVFNNNSNEIIISCHTKQEFSNCNNFITADINIDSIQSIVSIIPKVNTPMIGLPAFGRASGEIKFSPPSNRFQILFGNDRFNILLYENKLIIKPDSLTTNILKVK